MSREQNSQLISASVAHQIALLSYGNGVGRDAIGALNGADRELLGFLARHLRELLRETPLIQAERRRALSAAIRGINDAAYAEAEDVILAAMVALIAYEVTFQTDLLSRVLRRPVDVRLTDLDREALLLKPILGRTVAEGVRDAAARRLLQIETAIGLVLGSGGAAQDALDIIAGGDEDGPSGSVLDKARDWMRTLAGTDTVGVAGVAGEAVYEVSGVVEIELWLSVLDSRTTRLCSAQSNATRRIGGEWSTGYRGPDPPAHYNCLFGDALVAPVGGISAVSKRWYEGDAVVIRTASGKELSCTPNHPILTRRGWVFACRLNVGDYVVSYLGSERPGSVYGDQQEVPTRIEDVASAFLKAREVVAVPVPITAKDFHGDAVDGEIAVIGANRLLLDGSNSPLAQHLVKTHLGTTDPDAQGPLLGLGSLGQLLSGPGASTHAVVEGSELALAAMSGTIAPGCGALFASVALLKSELGKGSLNRFDGRRSDDFHCDASDTTASLKQLFGLGGLPVGQVDRRGSSPARPAALDSRSFELGVDDDLADRELALNILDGNTGDVALDKITGLSVIQLAGHVYNLQTSSGFYEANNIITHNCRSVVVPMLSTEIPDILNYEEWLRTLSVAEQVEILGPSRYALWSAGRLPLGSFVNDFGKAYTLADLEARDAAAFERAGLLPP